MKEIFLIGSVQAFFLSLLLLTKKNKIYADYILSAWLIFTGIPLFLYFYNYAEYTYILTHSQSVPTYLMLFNIPFILLQCPFVYIYVIMIVNRKNVFKITYLLHFIPAILFIVITLLFVDIKPADKTDFNIYDFKMYWLLISFFPLTFVMSIFYITKSFLLIRKYKKDILQQFSNTEKFDLTWLRNLVIIIAIIWSLLGIMTLTFKFYNDLHLVHHVILFAATVVIFVIGYFGLKRTSIFSSLPIQPSGVGEGANSKPENKLITPAITKQIEKVKNYMQTEKPYLKSSITISELSGELDMPPHELSKIINNHLEQNFFDFINTYRVNEVKKQLQQESKYTLLGIAYDCGFNSKSSFNRIFKKYTDETPSQYKKKVV